MKGLMYSEFAKDYGKAVENNIYNAHLERPSLQSMLPELKGRRVLDLGCGSGVYAEFLLAHGAEVTSVDASAEMVDIVQNKLGDQVRSYVQDLSVGLPSEESDSYDVVICPLVIHYIQDLLVLFRDIQRVVKPGGCFVFSTHHPMVDFKSSPSEDYFQRELLVQQWNTIGKPVEVKFYRRSLTELFGTLTKVGLCVTELTEGKPTEAMKAISAERYEHLSKKPNFIFLKCQPMI